MAALASSKQADEETITAAAADPDGQVRRLALVALAATAAGSVSEAARARIVAAGLADPDYLVRYEALRIHGRHAGDGAFADWAPGVRALSDAVTARGSAGHRSARGSARRARSRLSRGFARGWCAACAGRTTRRAGRLGSAKTIAEWHRAAHALVSLAQDRA